MPQGVVPLDAVVQRGRLTAGRSTDVSLAVDMVRASRELRAEGGFVTSRPVLSFLKWAGGKTRYASTLVALAPEYDGTYREPFVGSAAVFFALSPNRAVLSDANEDLVVCLQQVAADPKAVMALLDAMPRTAAHFAEVRTTDPAGLSPAERAARVIYLNKQSFRGLWRVNRSGQFNTPWGGYGDSRALYDQDVVLRTAEALAVAEVKCLEFEDALNEAEAGDFVYCDPPYVPLGGWADFKRYTAGQFHVADHRRLEKAMRRAADRGAHVMLTNSDTALVRDIWAEWCLWKMPTVRDINIDTAGRQSTDLVITSYTPPAIASLTSEDVSATA